KIYAAAIAFGTAVYFILSKQQEEQYQSSFQTHAREASDIILNNAENAFGLFQSLAVGITAHALTSEEAFPNVIVPYFDKKVSEVAELTEAKMIIWAPLVEEKNRTKFELDWLRRQGGIELDYETRGLNTSDLEPVKARVRECEWCSTINDTRRGYVDDGFMEEVMANRSFAAEGITAPVAQYGPMLKDTSLVGFDLYSHPIFKKEMVASVEYNVPVVSEKDDGLEFLYKHVECDVEDEFLSFTLDAVHENFDEDAKVVGFVVSVLPWSSFFKDLLPDDVNGLVVELVSDCGSNFTYIANGGKEDVLMEGNGHEVQHGESAVESRFFWKDHHKGKSRHCHFNSTVYPSDEFRSHYTSADPAFYAFMVVFFFVFTGYVFYESNRCVSARHSKLEARADRAVAVVNSVFPEQIGNRLLNDDKVHASGQQKLDAFLGSGTMYDDAKPLADFFLATTVLFADIAGFTAWSSTREPSQVFLLLESLYFQFDKIAKRRGIFKVETIGDSYVAAAGLPTPRNDHFSAMARFARDIMETMDVMTQKLEVELGPDTSSLGLRIGIHSGPVTAGVLRGDRARFQLFGDTVNTAARMESTGVAGRIQISESTAGLLEKSGKLTWFFPREDKVSAKGKGMLQTYWLHTNAPTSIETDRTEAASSMSSESCRRLLVLQEPVRDAKTERLVNWFVEILGSLLLKIINQRRAAKVVPTDPSAMRTIESKVAGNHMMMNEVVEVVNLYGNDDDGTAVDTDGDELTELDPEVQKQLHLYVGTIAGMYHNNPFHSFEHASHVTMSVIKLLNRIIARPDEFLNKSNSGGSDLNEHIYGDVLTQFAVAFSALLHDVDHSGVTNATLVQEGTDAAVLYGNKSVAEQNSIDLAWHLLMEDDFDDLRQAIYATESELLRFRQLVVNTILATDIMDKDLKKLREERWDKAFSSDVDSSCTLVGNMNRKGTIVIEHLIQASDVAHTMQHFHIYKKWNERLFMEMYKAYKAGRTSTDPSDGWYKGELGFFDFYILPLAKKLDTCGVFGVSSHEYLNYAQENRSEWEAKGMQLVEEYKAKVKQEFGDEYSKGGLIV
ncbi:MAG: hypothetical protein SGILL_004926, partial [Bacillariaceae sp.]